MTIFQQTFSTGDVIKAADMPMANFQNQVRRGLVTGHKDAPIEGGGSPGRHRRFTWYNVMEIATAQALMRAGMAELSNAYRAAQSFAHFGDAPLLGNPERQPGFPWKCKHGRTLLGVAGERAHVALWQPGKDALGTIREALGEPEGVVLLDVLATFDRVCGALGLQPSAVLNEAYPETSS